MDESEEAGESLSCLFERYAQHISVVKLILDVRYPDGYPDVLPELTMEPSEGDLGETEIQQLIQELHKVVRLTVGTLPA